MDRIQAREKKQHSDNSKNAVQQQDMDQNVRSVCIKKEQIAKKREETPSCEHVKRMHCMHERFTGQ
jgi:hypothetical protein